MITYHDTAETSPALGATERIQNDRPSSTGCRARRPGECIPQFRQTRQARRNPARPGQRSRNGTSPNRTPRGNPWPARRPNGPTPGREPSFSMIDFRWFCGRTQSAMPTVDECIKLSRTECCAANRPSKPILKRNKLAMTKCLAALGGLFE